MFRLYFRWRRLGRAWTKRQSGPRLRLHCGNIRTIDGGIYRYIGAEIHFHKRMTRFALRLTDIGRVHRAVASGIAEQYPHWNSDVAGTAVAGRIRQGDAEHLRVGHVVKVKRDGVAVHNRRVRGGQPIRARLRSFNCITTL